MSWGQRIKIVVIFAAVGPPIGGAIVALITTAQSIPEQTYGIGAWFAAAVVMLFLSMMFSFVMGLIPAAMTGTVAAILAGMVRPRWQWIGLLMIVGAVLSAWVGFGWPSPQDRWASWSDRLLLAAAGAFGSFICASMTYPTTKRPAHLRATNP